jgi:hypothetical protein
LFADKCENTTSEKQLGQSFWRDFFLTVVGVSDLLVAAIELEFPIRDETGRSSSWTASGQVWCWSNKSSQVETEE